MSEEAINRLLKREIGCTIREINAIIGYWLEKYDKEKTRKKELQEENSQLKQKLSILSVKPAIPTTDEKLKYRIEKAIEYITIYRSYENIDGKDYLKGRDEIGELNLLQVDKILEILKGDE